MPFVVLDTVKLTDIDKAREGLHASVIPFVKQQPGLIKGYWAADLDAGEGHGILVFETREQAEGMLAAMQAGSPPDGVTPVGAKILEVQGES